ncbi:60S ribosomal protein L31-A [Aspergillus niger]|nr:60S ribosomal protein L31-A [Aspergillus niger]
MFEDFSFSSPSSTRPSRLALDGDDRLMVDSDSSLISPMSSRCPSPRSHRFPRTASRSRSSYFRSTQQPPTSVPFSAYDHKRLSISTLTRKLHEHTLQNPNGLQPEEAGRFDRPASPTPSDLGISTNPTSVPADFPAADNIDLSGNGNATTAAPSSDAWTVRAQRQQISRLQCNQSDVEAIRRALVSDDEIMRSAMCRDSICEEDYHPSSLPPQSSPRRRALTLSRNRFRGQPSSTASAESAGPETRARRKSSVSALASSHRIEKSYHCSSRDMHKKNEQGLRRKSLVSAALASMVEQGPEE